MPQGTDNDRITCREKHGDGQTPPKYKEAQDIDKDKMLSSRTKAKTEFCQTINQKINEDCLMNRMQNFAHLTIEWR